MAAIASFLAWLLLYHVQVVLKSLLLNTFEASLQSFRKKFKRICLNLAVFMSLFWLENFLLPRNDQRKTLLEIGILGAIAVCELWQGNRRQIVKIDKKRKAEKRTMGRLKRARIRKLTLLLLLFSIFVYLDATGSRILDLKTIIDKHPTPSTNPSRKKIKNRTRK